MNRILLILLLISIGIYLYIILFKSNNNDKYDNVRSILKKNEYEHEHEHEHNLINNMNSNNKRVHFSENNEELRFSKEIEPSELINKSEKIYNTYNDNNNNDNDYNSIFIDPIMSNIKEVGYTNLTLSENEYFTNN